jgi:hypothetical protein
MSDTIIINPSSDNDTIIVNPIIDNETIIINGRGAVSTVNGRVGDVVLSSSDVGLTIVNTNSGNWDSSYSSVYANSALWTQGGNSVALQSLSSTWNSNYITTNSLSGNWNSVYSTVKSASSVWNLGGNSTVLQSNSANWNKGYQYGTAYSSNSANFATIQFVDGKFLAISGGEITGDLTIYGSLTALGKSTFVDTIFTTTSALSVINLGVGPALYVYQIAKPYDVASFIDGDGVEVLHVGNSNENDKRGKIGINESFPTVELTVNGRISASDIFYANGIESQGVITTTGLALQNSRVQYLERPVTANGNFILLNVNNELQAIRLFTPIIAGANFTNTAQDGDWSNLNNWTDIQGYSVTKLPDTESVLTFTVPSFTQVSEGTASIRSCNFSGTTSWGNGITLTVSNSANFNNQSVLYGTLSGDTSFYNTARNNGIIGGYASFNGSSVNSGLVVKNAVFRDAATNQNSAGIVAGNAIVYYPSPYPIGGTINGSVSYRGYFATKFVGTAGDGNWSNLANWTDDFDLPVVFLPTAGSNVKIYSNVNSASGNSATVNSAIFYGTSTWGATNTLLTLNASQLSLTQQSSNNGILNGTGSSLFRLYNLATNTGTINSDVEVNHPCPVPIGGTVNGDVSYVGYMTPIISTQLVNIQGPENITSISLTCNGNNMYPNFGTTIEDYGVVTGDGSGTQVNYSLTINGNTTTGTINVDQALQIYNTTNIYFIRFINSSIPRPTITSGPLTGYVPGYYTIGQNDYLPIIYNHNGVPVWYTNSPAIALHKGADRNRVMPHYSNSPHKTVYIGVSSLQVESYELIQYTGSWDIHEGLEVANPPNRKGNILGHVYTSNGFYIEEQTANRQLVWNWEANDYYSGGDNGYGAEYYHNNSIDVHPINGNYVISCRHNSAAMCIEYATKNIKWVITGTYFWYGGGTFESVDRGTPQTANTKYISEANSNLLNEPTHSGYAYSGTVGCHDARWHTDIAPIHGSNNVVFSIYDDESGDGGGFDGNPAPAARGVIYEVNESTGVAYHRSSVFSPYGTSPFRGSYTVVHEDDDSWSHTLCNVVQDPVMIEFVGDIDTPNKPLVFEMQFYSNVPYRIIKIKKSFFDLNNLRATYGMSV